MKFKGNIVITDPCYIIDNNKEEDDWEKCDYGESMEKLGFTTCIVNDTLYGDWSCTTFKDTPDAQKLLNDLDENYKELFTAVNYSEDEEKIKDIENKRKLLLDNDVVLGRFCADAGLVGVFYLDEILKYNPNYQEHLKGKDSYCATFINDFDGDIEISTTSPIPQQNNNNNDTNEDDEKCEDNYDEECVYVIGKGNINFFSIQTGF